MLQVVAQVDETPEFVQCEESRLPELLALLCRTRRVARSVLEHHLALSEKAAQRLAGPELSDDLSESSDD